jgi:hypothetical protein
MHRAIEITEIRRPLISIAIFVAVVALVGFNPLACHAQYGGNFGTPASKQINNPPVSPYLNLVQPGIDPALAYQTLVRPELQVRNALANQQMLLSDLQRGTTQPPSLLQSPTVLQTGHPTAFLNTGSYFFPVTTRNQRH